MKSIVKLLTLIFFFSAATVIASPVAIRPTSKTISSKHPDLFVFKVDRKFKKAMIEVYSSDGDLVAITALARRKMVINFREVKSGTYIIKVKKNNHVEEFQFEKK